MGVLFVFLRFPDYRLVLIISEIILLRILNYLWKTDSKHEQIFLPEIQMWFINTWIGKEQFCWVRNKINYSYLIIERTIEFPLVSCHGTDNCSGNATKPELPSRRKEEKRIYIRFSNRIKACFYCFTILFNHCEQFTKTEFKFYKFRDR